MAATLHRAKKRPPRGAGRSGRLAAAMVLLAAALAGTQPAMPAGGDGGAPVAGPELTPVTMPKPAERPRRIARAASVGPWKTWVASWYGEESGRVTASGEPFRPQGLTAAHRSLPFGTMLQVCNGERCVVVRINDRGPYVRGRDLDLSRGAAEALGMIDAGVAQVMVRVVREEDQR